jgi:hypothetical protein
VKYAWIDAHRAGFALNERCDVLEVSVGGYRAWQGGGTPDRQGLTDAQLLALIRSIHAELKGAYGRPRMVHERRARGFSASKARVERLMMREHGIRGRHKRRYKATTDSNAFHPRLHFPGGVSEGLEQHSVGRKTGRMNPCPWKTKNRGNLSQDVSGQIARGDRRLIGVMIESHLVAGNQNPSACDDLIFGQSITDACVGWDDTAPMLHELAEAVVKRRDCC